MGGSTEGVLRVRGKGVSLGLQEAHWQGCWFRCGFLQGDDDVFAHCCTHRCTPLSSAGATQVVNLELLSKPPEHRALSNPWPYYPRCAWCFCHSICSP